MDFKDFLWKHTLLPLELFFNPFKHKIHRCRNIFDYVEHAVFYNERFMYSNRQPYYGYLRFCPHCWAEQRAKYGEAYWLRDWFVFGNAICPKHHCKLLRTNTTVLTCSNFDKLPFPDEVEANAIVPDDELCVPHIWHEQLAADIAYILAQDKTPDWFWEPIALRRLNELWPLKQRKYIRTRRGRRPAPVRKIDVYDRFSLTFFRSAMTHVKNDSEIKHAKLKDLRMTPLPRLFITSILGRQGVFIENWLFRWMLFPHQSLPEIFAQSEQYLTTEDKVRLASLINIRDHEGPYEDIDEEDEDDYTDDEDDDTDELGDKMIILL